MLDSVYTSKHFQIHDAWCWTSCSSVTFIEHSIFCWGTVVMHFANEIRCNSLKWSQIIHFNFISSFPRQMESFLKWREDKSGSLWTCTFSRTLASTSASIMINAGHGRTSIYVVIKRVSLELFSPALRFRMNRKGEIFYDWS